jgi:hypothetical protein
LSDYIHKTHIYNTITDIYNICTYVSDNNKLVILHEYISNKKKKNQQKSSVFAAGKTNAHHFIQYNKINSKDICNNLHTSC